ncbi:MAG: hypothetical protein J6T70_14955 [Bacteroidales bacterium]|nr:hypothetical protein [Bacteroidales bacterium]
MKKHPTIIKAFLAAIVLMLCATTNANAQIGKNLLNKAKQAGKEIIQGNSGNSQQQSSQQQQPAQQQTTPQQNNNQTAQPSQQTTKPAPKQNAPAEKPKEYTKEDYTAESALLVGKVDANSTITDITRVYMFLYRKINNALDNKDYDFLVDSFSYYASVWRIVDSIGCVADYVACKLDDKYYAEDNPKEIKGYVLSDYVEMKSNFKEQGNAGRLQGRITESIKAVPYGQLADQNISAYIDIMLQKAEKCKSANTRGRFLKYILDDRNFYTIKNCRAYPTDESLYTERLRTFMETIPQDIIEKWHCPQLYTAEEIRNQRLEFIKSGLKSHPSLPKSRDVALEAKFKKEILAQRPEAKIKMVVFESDAIADWLVKKNEFFTPTRRIKKGWALVECPGQANMVGMVFLQSEQEYLGGGKYGASSVSCDIPPINDKMIFTEDWHYCKL